MPAYNENPTTDEILKRTRDRIRTVSNRLSRLASPRVDSEAREWARAAASNLELLDDAKERRQALQLTEFAEEIDAKLRALADECKAFALLQRIDDESIARLKNAIRRYLASPVASGMFIGGGSSRKMGAAGVDTASIIKVQAQSPSVRIAPATATPPSHRSAHLDGDSLIQILADEGRCKAAGTCGRLTIRGHYHEPNASTIEQWRAEGLYTNGIDRRVIFVCESPSDAARGRPPEFFVQGVGSYRTWAGLNHRTKPFFDMRRRLGFEHCMITNTVKCGCPSGVRDKPNTVEIGNCAPFLRREIELIQPAVVACLGKKAMEWAAAVVADVDVAPHPAQIYLTHYSAHEPPPELLRIWATQFDEIKDAIRARGLAGDRPVFLPVGA